MYLIKRQKDLLTEYRYASKDFRFLLYQEFVRFDTDLRTLFSHSAWKIISTARLETLSTNLAQQRPLQPWFRVMKKISKNHAVKVK